MITSNGDFYIETGSIAIFDAASLIFCYPKLDARTLDCTVDVQVRIDTGSSVPGAQYAGIALVFTKDDLTGRTASGADDVLEFQNLVEQAVDDYLENISENSGVNFTIV